MAKCRCFKPVSKKDACVLVLGSLPGKRSLEAKQYYAHKQNKFWKIMGVLFGAGPELPYEKRLELLIENKIALWDVCKTAEREGSLDADIKNAEPNDFGAFFKEHKKIELICFNGQPAHKMFSRYVSLNKAKKEIRILPSTSPAYAGMTYEKKLVLWRKGLLPKN